MKSWIAFAVFLGIVGYALAEDLTLTTYYPSPRGVYKELRASGDVAIGTTNAPTARLQVVGSLSAPALHVVGIGGTTTLRVDDAGSGDTSPFLINSTGDVAIGTSDPGGYKLRVQGDLVRFGTTTTNAFAFANGQVGIGTTAPAAGSLLELSSTSKALLLPRMNTGQRDAITPRVDGLLIYNTESDQLESCCDAGGNWKSAAGSSHGLQSFDATGTHTFNVPAGVDSLLVELWGGGGGGSGGDRPTGCAQSAGGAGGGGGYGKGIIPVISGQDYTVVVGAGGAGGITYTASVDGGAGGASRFYGNGVSASAGGGNGGMLPACSGLGGAGGTSNLTLSIGGSGGENGFVHSDTGVGHGGGGGDGGNGGAGGAGGIGDQAGTPGSPLGGGGGGGGAQSSGGNGGSGAAGKVVISW